MSQINLSQLIQQLDATTRSALEQATLSCANRQHEAVQPEHWLQQLISHSQELKTTLKNIGVELSLWQGQLDNYLRTLPTSGQRVPSLSPWLAQLLHECMLQAASEFKQIEVTAGVVLFTFSKLLQEQLYPAHSSHTALHAINLADLKNYLLSRQLQHLGERQNDSLDRYTTDLTALARMGKLDAVIGRETEIRQMTDILMRRRQNNPILVGEAGVGKTALVEGLALRIVKGDVPPALQNIQLLSLDLAALQAGASVQGEFEQRLKQLIQAIQHAKQTIILFIDEAHALIGAGGKTGQGDAANLLKPLLARGELRTIAATTWAEYKKYIENDAALTRRFDKVRVAEPDDEQAIAMLQGMLPKLEQHHGVLITPEAIVAAVKLSRRYLPERQLPDKAVSLLDTACARVQLSQHATPTALAACEQRIKQLQIQQAQLSRSVTLGDVAGSELEILEKSLAEQQEHYAQLQQAWHKEQQLIAWLKEQRQELLAASQEGQATQKTTYQTALTQLKQLQGEAGLMALQVDQAIIAQVVADSTGIPSDRLLRSHLTTTLNLANDLQERILGQAEAITVLAKKLQTARMNLQDPHKPQGVFLLAGSSGVGKTETAFTIAELLYGGRQALTVINMSEFKEPHKASMLTGAPAGYVGYGEGGVLTEAIRRRPYGVVLLDEIEKAHPEVQDIFFQVFDKGMLKDGQGREIDCRHTVFLLTSNAGARVLAKAEADQTDWQNALQEELLHYFKPAFLARITLLPYFALSPEIIHGIGRLKLRQVVERLQTQHHLPLTYTARLLRQLTTMAQASPHNAREIDQIIEAQILPRLSQYVMQILLENVTKPTQLKLDYHKQKGYVLISN